MSEKNWLNDPNGPVLYRGVYHLFYQYNPFEPIWGNMSWGHVASRDLVRWVHLPVALEPDQPYDRDGVFSGSITIVDGQPVISYTCVRAPYQRQCLAYPKNASDPFLIEWTKDPRNPVISAPPEGVPVDDFRDPTTAWKSATSSGWRMAIGGRIGDAGHVLLYGSSNFSAWEFRQSTWHSTSQPQFPMFECPDLYRLVSKSGSDHDVIKISCSGVDWAALGRYSDSAELFEATTLLRRIDYGIFYASKTFHDTGSDRRILWGWIREDDPHAAVRGWQGLQSLPTEVNFDPELELLMTYPIPELETLRLAETAGVGSTTLEPLAFRLVAGAQGLQLDIEATFSLPEDQHWRDCVVARSLPGRQRSSDWRSTCDRVATSRDPVSTFGVAVRVSQTTAHRTEAGFVVVHSSPRENTTDRPGGDYRDYTLPESMSHEETIANCSSACMEEPQCMAWTVVEENPTSLTDDNPIFPTGRRCSLKDRVPPPVFSVTCVSGTVPSLGIGVNRTLSGGEGGRDASMGPLLLKASEDTLHTRVLVDHSVVEVFAQYGRGRLTTRIYPDSFDDAPHVGVFSRLDTTVVMQALKAYTMGSVWT